MHLLAATPGAVADGAEAVDLGQTPGDIVILSAADTEIACLAQARAQMGDEFPEVRLGNLMQLSHNMSVDLYVDEIVSKAKFVLVRLIGGIGYWPYGVDEIVDACRRSGAKLAFVPGDDKPDPELFSRSNLPTEEVNRLWQYLVQGGVENAQNLLAYAGTLIGTEAEWQEPKPLLQCGYYWPGLSQPSLEDVRADWIAGAPSAAIVFYRALVQAGNTAPVDALIDGFKSRGINPLPIFVASLKNPVSAEFLTSTLSDEPPAAVLNATAFAVSTPGAEKSETPFDIADCPVFQIIFSGGSREAWESSASGLSSRDIAMNVALPEVDGRILTRALSFKAEDRYDQACQCSVVTYEPVADRISYVADLTTNWARLRSTEAADRKVALVMANYPNKDGRLGNGVGLDTPASITTIFAGLKDAGYALDGAPETSEALMAEVTSGPTNALSGRSGTSGGVHLSLASYQTFFDGLPQSVRDQVTERWGAAESDPFVEGDGFKLSIHRYGNVIIGVQPARGYNIDPVKTYHDPDLVPPHGYLAFYAWIAQEFGAHAVVHVGKHGNLEWLPGKALALSENCFPEAAFAPLPHLYPFIVNDPGEGSQAKRRSAAVIIDHLTPPLTRAESYGPLKELEALVDEYYQAAGIDPRRIKVLAEDILALMQSIGLDKDCGVSSEDDEDERLGKLDAYLCELKEMQIRDGLHIFGQSPQDRLRTDLLTALVRVPRGAGADGGDASLQRALAADLGFGEFDPLNCEMAEKWSGPKPEILVSQIADEDWRSNGDTVERLELLAANLIAGTTETDSSWTGTPRILDQLAEKIAPSLDTSGPSELSGLLAGLDGRFVAPGPSGAPTRGRPEVLPTGRNFYSVDTRAVPTAAAWTLGWKSASLLLDQYRQDNGEWPKRLALSAWGTANMRTGGDDIAQALALIGARPTWDTASGRVTGFEVLPLSVLGRPRVDVTLRISGFFRDAFPFQIDLLDSAFRAVAEMDEPATDNPLAQRVRDDAAKMIASGTAPETAQRKAGHRIFGSMPGAYGAGLQALIDERLWQDDKDFAEAYLAWGGFAYGGGVEGEAEQGLFSDRLKSTELVLHNQDNREHDLLDSDDYYQFEGGITAAIRHLSGNQPTVYHNDHSRPENPKIRTLEDEIGRVVRARVVNPKWIAGVMRHGYKGAFEMAATVDYLFAFAATARCVSDHHFDAVYEAYLNDDTVLEFLQDANPAALKEMAERLNEAMEKNLWRAKSNHAHAKLQSLRGAASN